MAAAMKGRSWAALVAASIVLGMPSAATAADPQSTDASGPFNNGEDVTDPRSQLQLRQRYQRLPDKGRLQPEKWTTTLRADLWSGLGGGWKIYGRIDEPLVYSDDVTSHFNPDGHSRFGQGDLLTELAIIAPPPSDRLGIGAGVRVVWPTAALDEAGEGKYQIGPAVAVRYSLPEIAPGSFFTTQLVYLNSVASRNQNSGRPDVNQLTIQPKLNVLLPEDWFVTTYSSNGIQLNYQASGKVFVPFDIMIGKRFLDNFVASIEPAFRIYHNQGYEPYRWQIEGRIGYFF